MCRAGTASSSQGSVSAESRAAEYGQFVGGGPTSRDLEGSWHADLRRRNLPAQWSAEELTCTGPRRTSPVASRPARKQPSSSCRMRADRNHRRGRAGFGTFYFAPPALAVVAARWACARWRSTVVFAFAAGATQSEVRPFGRRSRVCGVLDRDGAVRRHCVARLRLGSPRVQRMPEPDLIDLGPGWFAHPGRSGSTATRHRSRLGLPDVFVASSALSWIEMKAGADLHVCAVAGRRQERPATWTARRLARRSNDLPVVPTQVVDLRPGVVWPTPMNPLATHESTRRRASAFIAACGGYHADREPVALQRKVRT